MADKKKVITPVFRVSFPFVFSARAPMKGSGNSTPKFGVTAVFTPAKFDAADKKRWAEMKALADEVSREKFKKPIDKLPANFKKPLRDGNEKEDLEGFGEGTIFCNLTSRMKPGLIGPDKIDITDPEDFYPGCYARASITCYSYDNEGKGIAFGLNNLIKVRDGERLDSKTEATEDFADLGEAVTEADDLI